MEIVSVEKENKLFEKKYFKEYKKLKFPFSLEVVGVINPNNL